MMYVKRSLINFLITCSHNSKLNILAFGYAGHTEQDIVLKDIVTGTFYRQMDWLID